MKRKTAFLLYVLVGVILLFSFGLLVYVRAADQNSSSCASYLKDYFEKQTQYDSAVGIMQNAQVSVIKATPYASVPPELKDVADSYDSNPSAFMDSLKDGLSTHPNVPSNILGLLSGLSQASSLWDRRQVLSAAQSAYDSASTALSAAEKALANCTGQSIVTIYCERGAKCQMTPGVSGNPKAHYNGKCPDYIRVGAKLPLLAKACPGKWWSCEGVGQCPNRWSHLSDDDDDDTDEQACGHTYDPKSSSAHSHRSVSYACSTHTYYACQTPSTSSHAWVSSCSETENGKTCTNTSGYYACSPHSHSYPTDNTPNCSGCTTDCSYPCSCSGSGTCGGSTMPTPTDNTPNCSGCTSHCSSPCRCSESGTCNGTVAAPPPTPMPTPPPPSGPTCPSGHTYDPNNSSEVDRHTVLRICRRRNCGQTWYRCVGKPAFCKAIPSKKCWARNP
ncbi:MAG: hypothetical protein OXU51_02430 [Candidatus Poribacteria bacterium]|nr:hypothetical protein [Candidatus Poribacteria bacterium]